jgi:hypothetical protein
LDLISVLPAPEVVPDHDEVVHLVQSRSLDDRGIGWVDVHLLASASLSDAQLWTHDRALGDVARELGIGYDETDSADGA